MDNNTQAFLALVRAGLWERDVRLSQLGNIDFKEVYRLAQEQSVVGLVAAGLEHVRDMTVPKDITLSFVGEALQLEQRNSAMNSFIGIIVEKLRSAGVYTLLVKGQGIAQCYERPLWRAAGDIDLLLSKDNYNKAKEFLIPLASSVEQESSIALHLGMTIDSWIVELHGTLRSCVLGRMDRMIDEVQNDVFFGGNVRSWNNKGVQVFLPSYNNDVFLVFTHIIQHFFQEGIGMRQICDWCRLLKTADNNLNVQLLESRLKSAGIVTEWKAFSAYAVDYLGAPTELMPLFTPNRKWSRKAGRINRFVLVVGNFGHNRDNSYYNLPYLIRKAVSFFRRSTDRLYQLFIFPLDSFYNWWKVLIGGLTAVLMRK